MKNMEDLEINRCVKCLICNEEMDHPPEVIGMRILEHYIEFHEEIETYKLKCGHCDSFVVKTNKLDRFIEFLKTHSCSYLEKREEEIEKELEIEKENERIMNDYRTY